MKCGYWIDNEIRAYLGLCVCRRYTPRALNIKRQVKQYGTCRLDGKSGKWLNMQDAGTGADQYVSGPRSIRR